MSSRPADTSVRYLLALSSHVVPINSVVATYDGGLIASSSQFAVIMRRPDPSTGRATVGPD